MARLPKVKLRHRTTGERINVDAHVYGQDIGAYMEYELLRVVDPNTSSRELDAAVRRYHDDMALKRAAADHDGREAFNERKSGVPVVTPDPNAGTVPPPSGDPNTDPGGGPQDDDPDPRLADDIDTLDGLSGRTVTVLQGNDINTIGELLNRTQDELLALPNVGRTIGNEIVAAMVTAGLQFRETVPETE